MQNTPAFPSLEKLQNKAAIFDITKTAEYHNQKVALIKEMNRAADLGRNYLEFTICTVFPDLFYVFAAELGEMGYSAEFDLEDRILTIKW